MPEPVQPDVEEHLLLRKATRRAFRTDRIFRFTIDGRGYEWGEAEIAEPELRALAGVNPNEVLVLDREDGDIDLEPGERLVLSEAGTERLRTAKKLVRVTVDGVEKHIPRGKYTTEELLQVLGVAPGYLLNVIKDGELLTLGPGQKLHVREGTTFISQVPGGGSS